MTREEAMSMELISRTELLKAIGTWDKFGIDDTNHLFRLDNLSLPHYVPYIHYDDVIKCIKGMPTVKAILPIERLERIRAEIESRLYGVNIALDALAKDNALIPRMEAAKTTLEEVLEIIDEALKEQNG